MGRTAAGRMINQDIALSAKVASLSPEALALFCLLLPHLNSHGKLQANPFAIKGNVCPLIEWLTVEKVTECLAEISQKTRVKWWADAKGLYYLHSLNWKEHQTLREDRLGPDHLPDYPGDDNTSPGILPEYAGTSPAKGKGSEVKKEGKKEGKIVASSDALRLSGLLADLVADNNPSNRTVQPKQREKSVHGWAADIDRMFRLDGRSPAEVEEVIRWCQADTFWSDNILSGEKLRKQYDKLTLQMQRDGEKPARGGVVVPMAAGRRVY